MIDQSVLTELQQRRADLRARAIEQQQILAATMDELHAVNRAIKTRSKRQVVPAIISRIGSEGGRARMQAMTPEERSEQGRRGAAARNAKRNRDRHMQQASM